MEWKREIQRLLRLYGKGVYTWLETRARLMEYVEPDTVEEFVQIVPAELLEDLKKFAEAAPRSEDEWGAMISIRSWCGPRESAAERVQREREHEVQHQRWRRGVETLRDHFANEPPHPNA